MPRFRCHHCRGRAGKFFEFAADEVLPQCPQCGRWDRPDVIPLASVHLMALKDDGPIKGQHNFRWQICCQRKRSHLGAPDDRQFGASPDPRATTCPECKQSPEWKERARRFRELAEDMVRQERMARQAVLLDPQVKPAEGLASKAANPSDSKKG
jgi:hypothetical protein